MNILVTGANGFIGKALCKSLLDMDFAVRGVVRSDEAGIVAGVERIVVGDIGPQTNWDSVLKGVDTVVHLAARVHIMKDKAADPLSEFIAVNAAATEQLARTAASKGVRRLVFASTIKVNGESTKERPFREYDMPNPQDSYAVSKMEAERIINEVSKNTGLETVVLRLPLVYGPGVKGNMLKLMEYIHRKMPLPFGCIKNKRSLIGLENLTHAITTASTHADAAGHMFLLSDGQDISTLELIKRIADAMGIKPLLINIPESFFTAISVAMPPLRPVLERLTGSLAVDSSKFRRIIGWKPKLTVDEGIKSMVADFIS
ncbi:MAG: NAD-dependent epimerase/dehydratase family protein [Nitrospirae bacterium]|nr:NAD-dependent epimerase/dehydratase family protein [Nitrospirota bacterium]